MNNMPGDGHTIVGVNLPHIVLQPLEPDDAIQDRGHHAGLFLPLHAGCASIVAADSPFKTFADLVKARARETRRRDASPVRARTRRTTSRQVRLDRELKIKTTYVPFKGTGRPDRVRSSAATSRAAMSYSDARDPAEGQDAHARRRDREAPAAVS